MAKVTAPQTKVVETLKNFPSKDVLSKKARLGSPIAGKTVGETFNVVLTGEIEIREFEGNKSAYFLTKQGISIKVNASYDPTNLKAGQELQAICREFEAPQADGTTSPRKYAQLVD